MQEQKEKSFVFNFNLIASYWYRRLIFEEQQQQMQQGSRTI